MPQRIINPSNVSQAPEVFGNGDSNISLIEDAFMVKIMLRDILLIWRLRAACRWYGAILLMLFV